MIGSFVNWMKTQGWSAELEPKTLLTNVITDRYHNIPELWLQFVGTVNELASGDEMVWFLCAEDYNISFCHAWRWNEWEELSLKAAEGDEDWANEIRALGQPPPYCSVAAGQLCLLRHFHDRRLCGVWHRAGV